MSDATKVSSRVFECGHCRNITLMHEVAKFRRVFEDGEIETEKWSIWECQVCYKITVQEALIHFEDEWLMGLVETHTHYPTYKAPLCNLPQSVEYIKALEAKANEPNLFAVSVGRTLEAICIYEKAPGKDLAQKLDYLVHIGRISSTLAEMAKQLRKLRNLGAHSENDEVTEEDIPIILEFLEAILEYLYVIPSKIEAVRMRLNRVESEVNE